ncbi:MAG: c(7)-type cytochrome triheme domain-containing protein [Candidatus Thiodiazotropha sp.]
MKRTILRLCFMYICVMALLFACANPPKTSKASSENKGDSGQMKNTSSDPDKESKETKQIEDQQNIQSQDMTQAGLTEKPNANTPNEEPAKPLSNFSFNVTSESDPNRFNRLLEKHRSDAGKLHDPASPSLKILQKPSEAFTNLPKAKTGNKVDWVKAVESGKINPRHDIYDPGIKPMVMDLNIIMQVKGSMPDVVFPHRQHTRWLDCSNCHPAIFIPQSGANKMSMADNLLGQKCGVCHGKVAFPLSACTKCHSNKKIIVQEKK